MRYHEIPPEVYEHSIISQEKNTVAIEVQVKVNRASSDELFKVTNVVEKENMQMVPKLPNDFYFKLQEPEAAPLESFRTPQMGVAVDLKKTANFGANFQYSDKKNEMNNPYNFKVPERAQNRYMITDVTHEKVKGLHDSTLTFAAKDRQSQDMEQFDQLAKPVKNFRAGRYRSSNDISNSQEIFEHSFGQDDTQLSFRDERRMSEPCDTQEKLKLNKEVLEFNTTCADEIIAKDRNIMSSRSKKTNNSDFKFKVEAENPLLNDLMQLKANFIKNSGTLQKKTSKADIIN